MNRIFKVVWNQALGTWMAVSELGNKNRKTKSSRTQKGTLLAGALGIALAGAQAEEVTGEEIIDHGDRLEIRNLHQLKKITDKSGNETYESSGVFYNEKITGDTSLEISAPNIKYKKEKATDYIVEGNDEYHRGQDDRYGRGVLLEYVDGGNTYTGDTIVNHGVTLHVGRTKDDKNILGDASNNLIVKGYTDVTIHGTEQVKSLTFEAGNEGRIVRDAGDVEKFHTDENDLNYSIANAPAGGSLHVDLGAKLTVTGETKFEGNDDYLVRISAHGGQVVLGGKAAFNLGQLVANPKSDSTSTIITNEAIEFTGHNSGIRVYDGSKYIAEKTFTQTNVGGHNSYNVINRGGG